MLNGIIGLIGAIAGLITALTGFVGMIVVARRTSPKERGSAAQGALEHLAPGPPPDADITEAIAETGDPHD